jgi:hypothetical protein
MRILWIVAQDAAKVELGHDFDRRQAAAGMAGACLGRHREHLTPEATRDLPQLILLVPSGGLTSSVLIAFQEGLLPIQPMVTETRLP